MFSMQVLILHGWENNSKDNWFPWLKKQLEKNDITVYSPDLPDSGVPSQEAWLQKIRKTLPLFNDDCVIIGHSLGVVAILRLLETFSENEKIRAAILVAGFTQSFSINAISDFFKKPFEWDTIKSKSRKFIIINSENDPYLPLSEGEKLRTKLDGSFIIEKNAGHINKASGFVTYPRVFDLIMGLK